MKKNNEPNIFVWDFIDNCIDKFIDICVEWLMKSDSIFFIEKFKSKDKTWLTKWFKARKLVWENQQRK